MKERLFRDERWLSLPVHPIGWLLLLGAVATDVWFFIMIDRNSHSASDTLINFLPYCASVWVFFSYIASHTSEKQNRE